MDQDFGQAIGSDQALYVYKRPGSGECRACVYHPFYLRGHSHDPSATNTGSLPRSTLQPPLIIELMKSLQKVPLRHGFPLTSLSKDS